MNISTITERSKLELAGIAFLATAAPFVPVSVYQIGDVAVNEALADTAGINGYRGYQEQVASEAEFNAGWRNLGAAAIMGGSGSMIFAAGRKLRRSAEENATE